jgi:hypothetical protein
MIRCGRSSGGDRCIFAASKEETDSRYEGITEWMAGGRKRPGRQRSDIIETHKSKKRDVGVVMSRKLRLSSMVFTAWLMVIIAFMLFRRTFDLEIFFVLALIGLLVIVILIDTSSVQPRYLRRMKYMVAASLLIFGFIVANRIVEILAQ